MSALQQSNSFSAHLALAAGVAVSITASTLADLQQVVGKLQPVEAANDTVLRGATAEQAAAPAPASTGKAKPAATPASTSAPAAAGNASASTGTPASAQAAASGSAPAAEEKRPTYDDIKARVLALAKVSRDTASGALQKFGVDHANKLQLEQYADFIVHADQLLAATGKA